MKKTIQTLSVILLVFFFTDVFSSNQDKVDWKLSYPDLQNLNFRGMDPRGEDSSGADLYRVDFLSSDLSNAIFKDVNILLTRFLEANPSGTKIFSKGFFRCGYINKRFS